jgi:hypothetical protein
MIVLILSEKVEWSLHLEPKRKHKKFGGLEIVIAGNSDLVGGSGRFSGRNKYGKVVRKVLQGKWRARHGRVSP